MANKFLCPSCGGSVNFVNAANLYAVCSYCRSMLLRQGEGLEKIGEMGFLQDDPGVLQLGSGGFEKGNRFSLIGRLRLAWEDGFWNEWLAWVDSGETGWLGEA